MREILFRGKRVDDGRWMEGFYFEELGPPVCFKEDKQEPSKHWIFFQGMSDWGLPRQMYKTQVIPKTVGQYTGLMDKNGKRIFEGDIVSYNKSAEVVIWDTSLNIPCFCLGVGRGSSTAPHPYKITKQHVVIGNIYDNPELLEEDE